jgi:fatty-acyl-CoA synthase
MDMRSPTLPSTLDDIAADTPERTAVIDGSRAVTYGRLARRTERLAAGLREYGVGPGDRVAILMENRVEWVETALAVQRLGASVVGVSTWAERRELEYYLTHSGATALVATASFAGNDYAATLLDLLGYEDCDPGALEAASAPALETVVLLGADRPGTVRFDALPADGDVEDQSDPEEEAYLLYTSGSTSKPKGVPLLHGDTLENADHIGRRLHVTGQDRLWLSSPLFWSYGAVNALGVVLARAASIVVQAPFDPERAIDLVDEYDCTVYYGMPTMARDIVAADNFDADRLGFRTGTTIGQPEDIEFTMDELGVPELCNIYGSTETYGNCAVTDASLPRETRLHAQGCPLPGQDVVVTDPETGERLEHGEVGEIRVGGRITPGYHDDPEKNETAFDERGYLQTGDLGLLDADGRVRFRGRLKNMIKTAGINVSPVEVEEYLLDQPDVDQAYVVGLDDPDRDEIVAAVVVPRPEERLSAEEVHDHCEGLAGYKRPRSVVVVDTPRLPQTDTGKIKRNELGELFDRE